MLNLKKNYCLVAGGLICLIVFLPWVAHSGKSPPTDIPAPEVFFPEPMHTFEDVVEGKFIVHEFIIENRGKKALKIRQVKPGWGCTTISYSRAILPGEEGNISIKVNTKGFGGGTLYKSVQVFTNDPKTPKYKLTISGKIEKFVSIEPRFVLFEGNPDQIQNSIVIIMPMLKYPFVINKIRTKGGEWIEHTIEPWDADGQKGYRLVVTNLKKTPGNYRDAIILETNSSIQPEIRINVFADLKIGQSDKSAIPDNNAFIELIKKIQKEQANKATNTGLSPPPQAQSKDLKKLFEQLIKQKQEQEHLPK